MMKKALIDKIKSIIFRVMVHMTSYPKLNLQRKWQKNILKLLMILKTLLT